MPAQTTGGYQGNEAYNFGRNSYTTIQKYTNLETKLSDSTGGSGYGRRRTSALLRALVAGGVGQSKAATITRRRAFMQEGATGLGGAVPMETYVIQSGNTTAADVTRIQTITSPYILGATGAPGSFFPVNRDGVGLGLGNNGRTGSI